MAPPEAWDQKPAKAGKGKIYIYMSGRGTFARAALTTVLGVLRCAPRNGAAIILEHVELVLSRVRAIVVVDLVLGRRHVRPGGRLHAQPRQLQLGQLRQPRAGAGQALARDLEVRVDRPDGDVGQAAELALEHARHQHAPLVAVQLLGLRLLRRGWFPPSAAGRVDTAAGRDGDARAGDVAAHLERRFARLHRHLDDPVQQALDVEYHACICACPCGCRLDHADQHLKRAVVRRGAWRPHQPLARHRQEVLHVEQLAFVERSLEATCGYGGKQVCSLRSHGYAEAAPERWPFRRRLDGGGLGSGGRAGGRRRRDDGSCGCPLRSHNRGSSSSSSRGSGSSGRRRTRSSGRATSRGRRRGSRRLWRGRWAGAARPFCRAA